MANVLKNVKSAYKLGKFCKWRESRFSPTFPSTLKELDNKYDGIKRDL